ncbi:MAG: PD-(D/E)XK nuclease family protein, partial [Erysipelotrichaceae bacterium]|nr:PD-(D/E)XK nuclease family protein [Erysipelotrichaceae bacterium]
EDILKAKNALEWINDILSHKAHPCLLRMVEEIPEEEAKTLFVTPDRSMPPVPVWNGSEEERREILEKLSYHYPYLWRSGVPKKLSVSEVKHARMDDVAELLQDDDDEPVAAAYFAGGSPTGGAARGTAFHNIMAYCQMEKLADPEEREQEIARLVRENKMTQEDVDLVGPGWIKRFTRSKLYQRILASPKVYREQPFILSLSLEKLLQYSSRFDFGGTGDERLIMQGIIDLFFIEEDGIVLADYKTDAVLDAPKIEGYTVQLKLYRDAIEDALKLPVKEMILYGVRKGEEIRC